MKKALATAVLVLGCVSAQAGEMNWTGFHAGLNGGYGWVSGGVTALPGDPLTQSLSFGQPVVPPVSTSLNTTGGLGGGQLGYDWQFAGRGVVGIEDDISAADLKSRASLSVRDAARDIRRQPEHRLVRHDPRAAWRSRHSRPADLRHRWFRLWQGG